MASLINVRRKILLNTPHLETVSGSVVSFNTNMKAKLKDCKIYIEPIQEGSGDPALDNERPITGWTGVNISKCGENLQNGELISISWQTEASTVFGGYLNPLTGILTSEYVEKTFNGSSDENWGYVASGTKRYFRIIIGNYGSVVNHSQYCNIYKDENISSNTTAIGINVANVDSQRKAYVAVRPNNDGITTAAFKALLAEQSMQVVYKLTTPITYQLTPQEIKTLCGVNNIWSDTGNIEVTYWTH